MKPDFFKTGFFFIKIVKIKFKYNLGHEKRHECRPISTFFDVEKINYNLEIYLKYFKIIIIML